MIQLYQAVHAAEAGDVALSINVAKNEKIEALAAISAEIDALVRFENEPLIVQKAWFDIRDTLHFCNTFSEVPNNIKFHDGPYKLEYELLKAQYDENGNEDVRDVLRVKLSDAKGDVIAEVYDYQRNINIDDDYELMEVFFKSKLYVMLEQDRS